MRRTRLRAAIYIVKKQKILSTKSKTENFLGLSHMFAVFTKRVWIPEIYASTCEKSPNRLGSEMPPNAVMYTNLVHCGRSQKLLELFLAPVVSNQIDFRGDLFRWPQNWGRVSPKANHIVSTRRFFFCFFFF